jgi:hypothetical protein
VAINIIKYPPKTSKNVPQHFLFLIHYTEKIHAQKKIIGYDKVDLDAADFLHRSRAGFK